MEENEKVQKTSINMSQKLPPRPIKPKPAAMPESQINNQVNGVIGAPQQNVKGEEVKNVGLDNKKQTINNKKAIKPEKQPKVKKEKRRRKINTKALILTFVILFAVLGAAGGVTAMVLINKENNKKLLTPTLEVVQLYNGTILSVNKQDKATKYEFVIKDSSNKETTLSSSTNILELKTYLSQAGSYSARARVFGKGSKATSAYCEFVDFENRVTLETPKVYVNNTDEIKQDGVVVGYKNNEFIDDDTISWNSVKNASKYYVRYGVDLTSKEVKYEEVYAQQGVVTFSLSKIYQHGTGRYQISVVAVPETGSYYLMSDSQEIINIEYYAKQPSVNNPIFNAQTKVLTFALPSNINKDAEFDLYIEYTNETKSHKVYLADIELFEVDGKQVAKYTLENFISGQSILRMTLVTLSDGVYSSNSEPVQITIE